MMFELSQGIDEVFSILKETVVKSNWFLHCDEEVKIYNTSRTSLFFTCLLSPANAVCLERNQGNVEDDDKNTSLNMESLSVSDKCKVSLQDQAVDRWTMIRKALLASIVGQSK